MRARLQESIATMIKTRCFGKPVFVSSQSPALPAGKETPDTGPAPPLPRPSIATLNGPLSIASQATLSEFS